MRKYPYGIGLLYRRKTLSTPCGRWNPILEPPFGQLELVSCDEPGENSIFPCDPGPNRLLTRLLARKGFARAILRSGEEAASSGASKLPPDFRESAGLLSQIQDEITSQATSSYSLDCLAGWLTLAAVIVILLVALFPFNFSVQATGFRREGFFIEWLTPVAKHWLGWFLNVLFFFPFGVAWAWWTRATGRLRLANWLATGLAGFTLSLAVEWLQLYVPTRDSSWDDVFMNTLGALVGWLFFRYLGTACLRFVENALDDWSAALGR